MENFGDTTMTSKHRKAIERVREYLLEADIDDDRKDVLQVMLDKADEAANGCSTEQRTHLLSEVLHMYVIDHVRESIRAPQRHKELAMLCVAAHVDEAHKQPVTFREALIQSVTKCPYAAAAVAIAWMMVTRMV